MTPNPNPNDDFSPSSEESHEEREICQQLKNVMQKEAESAPACPTRRRFLEEIVAVTIPVAVLMRWGNTADAASESCWICDANCLAHCYDGCYACKDWIAECSLCRYPHYQK